MSEQLQYDMPEHCFNDNNHQKAYELIKPISKICGVSFEQTKAVILEISEKINKKTNIMENENNAEEPNEQEKKIVDAEDGFYNCNSCGNSVPNGQECTGDHNSNPG